MMSKWGALLALSLAPLMTVSPARAEQPAPPSSLSRVFNYDRGLPLALRVVSESTHGQIAVRALSFAIDRTTRTSAYLVTPRRHRSGVAIVFDPGRWQSRDFFLSEAIGYARHGVVALSLDDLSRGYPSFGSSDRAVLIQRVVALRRAIDLLDVQPGVDPSKLGFVGHSDGAELGGILAGIDRRISAYVLMSGGGVWDRSRDPAYNNLIAPLAPDNYIGYAAPASLFYQSALDDQFVPHSDALRYQRLGSQPKTVKWYAAGHLLNARAQRDRQTWLAARLHFGGR
ncbi:MAG: dienelactone hydrolase family protein [Gaiellaceae bacterium]